MVSLTQKRRSILVKPRVLCGYALGFGEQLDFVVESIGWSFGLVAISNGFADLTLAIVLAVIDRVKRFILDPTPKRRTLNRILVPGVARREKDVPTISRSIALRKLSAILRV